MPGQVQDPNVYLPQTNGQQGFMGYNAVSPYGVMPPPSTGVTGASALNGQGGYVGGRFGAAVQGVQGGFNFDSNIHGQARASQQYEQEQRAQRDQQQVADTKIVSAAPMDPSDPSYASNQLTRKQAQQRLAQLNQPQGLEGFYGALSHGIQKIRGILPGAQQTVPGAPQGAPGVQAQAAPVTTAAPVQGQQAPGLMRGGVMPDFMTAGSPGVVPASTEGQQPPGRTPTQHGYMGFAAGGVVPQQQPQPAAQQAPQPTTAVAAPTQAPAQGQTGPPGNFVQEAPPAQVLPPNYQDPSGPFNQYYGGLLKAALNDKGEPQGREAVPSATANPNVATQSAANNPAAQQGIPEDSPAASGQPHSLSPGWYEQQDALALQAAGSAARAGHDPQSVYSALTNMTTSWLQTHIMREAGAAAVAVQSGDLKATEQALKNMYYYIPDGQELSTSKVGGTLTYQDPLHPYLDAQGQPTDQASPGAKPNMIPVDAMHISMLAQAAANPAEIGGLIQNARIAQMKSQSERMTAQGALDRGQGIQASGQAALGRAQASIARVPYENIKDYDDGQRALMQASTTKFALKGLAGLRIDPSLIKNAQDAGSALDNLYLGPPTIDQNPVSPNSGKVTHDVTRSAPGSQNMTGQEYAQAKSLATQLGAAGVPSGQAAQLADSARQNSRTSHAAAADTSPLAGGKKSGSVPNVVIDHQGLHMWTGKNWQTYPLADPNAALAASRDREGFMAILTASSGAGGSPGVMPGGGGEQDQTAALDAAGDTGASAGPAP